MKFLTVKDIASALGVNASKVTMWIHTGELPAVNVAAREGGKPRWRVTESEFNDFAQRRTKRKAEARRKKYIPPSRVIEFFK